MQIREITPEDRECWLALRSELWPRYDISQLREEIEQFLAERDNWALFFALVDEKPVGFVECRLRDTAAGCSTHGVGYLEGWYVAEAHRGRGLGGALVAAAEEWARARGATEMASDTTTEYPVSRAAHAALGFEEVKRRFLFRKEL
ncbi:MAG: GNAT family N-acetyltransferase [Planctomycetota bacterium]